MPTYRTIYERGDVRLTVCRVCQVHCYQANIEGRNVSIGRSSIERMEHDLNLPDEPPLMAIYVGSSLKVNRVDAEGIVAAFHEDGGSH